MNRTELVGGAGFDDSVCFDVALPGVLRRCSAQVRPNVSVVAFVPVGVSSDTVADAVTVFQPIRGIQLQRAPLENLVFGRTPL